MFWKDTKQVGDKWDTQLIKAVVIRIACLWKRHTQPGANKLLFCVKKTGNSEPYLAPSQQGPVFYFSDILLVCALSFVVHASDI